jgi:tetratricopeptide (TPR) repeat protein
MFNSRRRFHQLRRRSWVLFAGALLFAVSGRVSAQENLVDRRVTVINADAEFKSQNAKEIVGKARLGENFKVDRLDGDRLWIEERQGSLKRDDVVPYEEAIDHFTAPIDRDPSAKSYHNRAIAWFHRAEFDIALGDLNDAIRLDSRNIFS